MSYFREEGVGVGVSVGAGVGVIVRQPFSG